MKSYDYSTVGIYLVRRLRTRKERIVPVSHFQSKPHPWRLDLLDCRASFTPRERTNARGILGERLGDSGGLAEGEEPKESEPEDRFVEGWTKHDR